MANEASSHRGVVGKTLLATVVMFGFGYAMVPLYDIICDITGLNGKTGRISAAEHPGRALPDQLLRRESEFKKRCRAGYPECVAVHSGKVFQQDRVFLLHAPGI